MEEKLAASEVFKVVWRRCIEDAEYLRLKTEWQREKKAYIKAGGEIMHQPYGSGRKVVKKEIKSEHDGKIKVEDGDD